MPHTHFLSADAPAQGPATASPAGKTNVMFPSGAHSRFPVRRFRFFPLLGLALRMLCVAVLVAGCTASRERIPVEPAVKYQADPEEAMALYTPRDDGLPLNAAELDAFKTVSDLDRGLSEEEARIVELHFKYFAHQKRDTFERFLLRAARFLPYVKKTFTDRGIPEDIAYLFMVESGGNPVARSPAGAVGLWQFMPFTGKKYGLTQTNWVDERRDPYKSTRAAADYLLKLYNDFSNWHLAVAAYNAGEGKIGRAVNGTGASDFFDLCRLDGQLEERARLRNETRDYVPRLIAVAKIMRNLKQLGFNEPNPGMAWDLAPMDVPPGTNLAGLSRQLGFNWQEFSGMNPAYLRAASPPTTLSTAYVPPERLSEAVRWAAAPEARMYSGWKEYRVRPGDTLASLARRHKVSATSIQEANAIQALPKKGSVLLIPGPSTSGVLAVQPAETASSAKRAPTARGAKRFHTISSGDTLYSLALKWGTDVASIREANRMKPKETALKPGQKLTIPANSKTPPAARSTPARKAPSKPASPKTGAVAKPGQQALRATGGTKPPEQSGVLVLGSYMAEADAPGSGARAVGNAPPLQHAHAAKSVYDNGIPEAYIPPASRAAAALPAAYASAGRAEAP